MGTDDVQLLIVQKSDDKLDLLIYDPMPGGSGLLEQMLARAQGTDFANPDTSKVTLGTKVTLKDTASGEILTYTLLGAWDGDPAKGIISYQTAVARALLNHAVGEKIELSTDEGGTREVMIEKIEPHGVDLSVPA